MIPAPAPHLLDQAEQAERLARAGDHGAAAQLFERVLAQAPNAARALGFFAMRALERGELAQARDLAERAAAGWPRLAVFEAQRAQVLLALGEREAALQALLAALERDPEFAPARLDAAELLDALGRPREAAEHYRRALDRLPPDEALPPPLLARVGRARAALAREQAALEAVLEARLAPLRARLAPAELERFAECEAIFHGRQRPQVPKPGMMHFPKLAPLTFFPRAMFDWIDRAEAATARVREELRGVLAGGDAGFIPYVQKDAQEAGRVWAPLNQKTDWGAYFLFNQGERVARHCDACPQTAALLESLPLVRIPGRGPTAFFSRLRPGVRIPPHHGATNTRCIVHLPLVVPPGCALRVGNDVRAWREGELLVFDDTLEHEAWNGSEQDRVVLIFDVWNPFLSAAERELVTAMTAGLAEFHPGQQHKTDF